MVVVQIAADPQLQAELDTAAVAAVVEVVVAVVAVGADAVECLVEELEWEEGQT